MRNGGFHISSSHVRNYVLEPRLLIGPTEAGVSHLKCPYHPMHNSSALAIVQIPGVFESNFFFYL